VTAEVERRKIEETMREAGGDRQRAAQALQISFKMLLQKIKEYGIAERST
jgi:DNA-binding NtrC family response regulator